VVIYIKKMKLVSQLLVFLAMAIRLSVSHSSNLLAVEGLPGLLRTPISSHLLKTLHGSGRLTAQSAQMVLEAYDASYQSGGVDSPYLLKIFREKQQAVADLVIMATSWSTLTKAERALAELAVVYDTTVNSSSLNRDGRINALAAALNVDKKNLQFNNDGTLQVSRSTQPDIFIAHRNRRGANESVDIDIRDEAGQRISGIAWSGDEGLIVRQQGDLIDLQGHYRKMHDFAQGEDHLDFDRGSAYLLRSVPSEHVYDVNHIDGVQSTEVRAIDYLPKARKADVDPMVRLQQLRSLYYVAPEIAETRHEADRQQPVQKVFLHSRHVSAVSP